VRIYVLFYSHPVVYQVKVTDFGLAKKANREGLKTFCGTPQYFAPEVSVHLHLSRPLVWCTVTADRNAFSL
jgi:serine/threonine protein kinase